MTENNEELHGFIYGLFDESRPEEIRYIGQTITKLSYRLRKHIHRAMNYRNFSNHNSSWIRKIINSGRKINILLIESVDCFDRLVLNDLLDDREIFQISLFRKMGFDLTNCTNGGEGTRGRKIPDEEKLKISASVRNNPNSIKNRIYAWFNTLTTEQICAITNKQFCDFILSFKPNWSPVKNENSERVIQHLYSYRSSYMKTKNQNEYGLFLSIVKAGTPFTEEAKKKLSATNTGKPWTQKRRDAEKTKKPYSWHNR